MQTMFADQLLNLSLGSGLVRLEFGVVDQAPSEATQGKAVTQPAYRLVMPLDGFVKSLQAQQGLAEALVKAGVLKPAVQASETAA